MEIKCGQAGDQIKTAEQKPEAKIWQHRTERIEKQKRER